MNLQDRRSTEQEYWQENRAASVPHLQLAKVPMEKEPFRVADVLTKTQTFASAFRIMWIPLHNFEAGAISALSYTDTHTRRCVKVSNDDCFAPFPLALPQKGKKSCGG